MNFVGNILLIIQEEDVFVIIERNLFFEIILTIYLLLLIRFNLVLDLPESDTVIDIMVDSI